MRVTSSRHNWICINANPMPLHLMSYTSWTCLVVVIYIGQTPLVAKHHANTINTRFSMPIAFNAQFQWNRQCLFPLLYSCWSQGEKMDNIPQLICGRIQVYFFPLCYVVIFNLAKSSSDWLNGQFSSSGYLLCSTGIFCSVSDRHGMKDNLEKSIHVFCVQCH